MPATSTAGVACCRRCAGGIRRCSTRRADQSCRGVDRREHLRRPGCAAAVGGGRGCARSAGVSGSEHAGCDDRQPFPAVRPFRVGGSATRRRAQLPAGSVDRAADGAVRPVAGGSPAAAVRAWRLDARNHPSPNAGVAEAAFAGALGVRLGGPTQYAHELQIRPTLGDGRSPRWPICGGRCGCHGRCRRLRGVGGDGGGSAPPAVAVGELVFGVAGAVDSAVTLSRRR